MVYLKVYTRYSQKNVRYYVESFLEAYLGSSKTSMIEFFCGNS